MRPLRASIECLGLCVLMMSYATGAHSEVLGLSCAFDKGVIGDIPLDGKIKTQKVDEELRYTFALERGEPSGLIEGNQGRSEVTALWRGQIITIMEPLLTGAFHVTTVLGSAEGVWPATTSRHFATLDGEPFASQYYGLCQVKPAEAN